MSAKSYDLGNNTIVVIINIVSILVFIKKFPLHVLCDFKFDALCDENDSDLRRSVVSSAYFDFFQ
jgi:hypothetical protein